MSGEAVDVDNVRKECTLRLVEEHPEITDYPSQIEAIIACMDEKGGSDNVDAHH
jgi:hypothetical protein